MAIDEIEAHEAAKIEYDPIQMLTNMAINEYEKQQATKPTFYGLMHTMMQEKRNVRPFVEFLGELAESQKAEKSMHEAFVNLALE